jgi:phosphate-selective porin OprO/OprP
MKRLLLYNSLYFIKYNDYSIRIIMKHLEIKKVILALIVVSISTRALANDARLEDRVKQLEELLKTMQQQRAEQDKQVEILTKELVGIENQMIQKANKADEDKKITPVVTAGQEGFGFKSADGKNSITLTGRVQAEYRTYGKSDAQNADTTDLRRAYLTLSGKMFGEYDFKVSGDFAGQLNDAGITSATSPSVTAVKTSKTILDEVYFGINWWKQAKFRFGQFQMPFGLETATSDLFNDFTERSVVNALTPFKERGGMVYGNPIDGVYYGLAISNGRGKNSNNTDTVNDDSEVIGRGSVNLAKFFNSKNTVVHVGGSFSHGYISGNQATNSSTLNSNSFLVGQGLAASQTEGRGIQFFTPTGLGVSNNSDVERTRLGAEAAFAYGPLKLQTEYVTHNYSGIGSYSTGTSPNVVLHSNVAFDKDIDAWYVSANWMVTGESYADSYLADSGTWGRVKPKNNLDFSNGKLGTIVLGLRYSDYDANSFKAGVGGAGATPTGAHAWTGAVTWILNPNTRLAINYVDTKFENGIYTYKDTSGNPLGTTNGEKALTLRGQFDF